ncbi:hypothetical protein GC105_15465 [Alkalibaculum sp. M08DMB]|uniref:Uncharacterized protein n=1 Tax=Alkalibaculum sporogenes TaxID=2655001 RepID=A0A6A7KCK6_9FIRM|nr:hypothetical protein [Alkalibaculum sporogenes]MPW27174.1 hypothetical protein [Alkalibaculum sporogenes]
MNKFGYIINPKDTQLYQLSGGFNKIKLNLPIIKDEVMKISEIYDKNNCYIGDILSIPEHENLQVIKEKLLNYIKKNNLEFICLGDAVRRSKISELNNHEFITGFKGVAYVSTLYINQYLEDLLNKSIYDVEIIIAIDEFNSITYEYIKFLSSKVNFMTLTGYNIELDEKVHEEIYNDYGISVGFCKDYRKLSPKWDIFINLSSNIQAKFIDTNATKGIIMDPFFLVKQSSEKSNIKYINNLGLCSKNIVFFNKLNIINSIYSPQLIESLARIKSPYSTDDIIGLIEKEIKENEYTLINDSLI